MCLQTSLGNAKTCKLNLQYCGLYLCWCLFYFKQTMLCYVSEGATVLRTMVCVCLSGVTILLDGVDFGTFNSVECVKRTDCDTISAHI